MQPKTCALDIIPTSKLQEILGGCLPAITHLVNSSLDQGVFCEEWKEALVKPLIKKKLLGTQNSNYMPVSNLSFISKIIEKVTLEQFNQHCQENSLVLEYQSAYRKNHSCETSLVKLVNDILWNMDRQLVTAIVIIDLSTAFDTVDHNLLLDVLENRFGITGTARRWYASYLQPRIFRVLVGKEESQPRQLDYSVPQGRIQRTFLFVAYASTLDEIVDNTKLELNGFADDHGVRRSFKPSKLDHKEELDTIAIMEQSMLDIKSWMDQVHLKMNDSKTKFIYFGLPSQLDKCITTTINVNGEEIERANITKYLGAHLDSKLDFKEHIKTKCKATMLNVYRVRAAMKNLTRSACNKLMVALVLSHLDYANSLLGNLPKSSINKMQLVQNIAARITLGKGKYESATRCLEKLDLTAFDTVDHDLLLGVLATRFGIQGKALEWYSNYLKPRRFRVTIEEEISKPRQLDYSVPQGSIQGAFLFIAYASTLDQVIDPSQLELNGFADDHSVRSSFKPSKLDHTKEH